MPEITIPHLYQPRDYQLPILQAIDKGYKRIIQVWHRRSGKEKTDINIVARELMRRKGGCYYIFPTYSQGEKILWNGIDKNGFKFLDHFPKILRKKTINDAMLIELINGSTFQVIGANNIDSIVGTNPIIVVFSEYSLQDPRVWDYMRPILAENDGIAIFNFTPRGENHAKDLLDYAKTDPDNWFTSLLTVDDTGAISKKAIEQERKEIIAKNGDDSIFLQEYFCSFTAGVSGNYYHKLIDTMEKEGRITTVPYESNLLVDTWWDLGINDSMTIGFFQKNGKEWRMIDYEEGSGEGLNYYIQILKNKNYQYGKHYAPHDITVRELGTGKSRYETACNLGINFEVKKENEKIKSVVPMLSVQDGIDALRVRLGSLWIDSRNCQRAIKAIKNYSKDFDEKNKVYRNNPRHDWSSHCSDMMRYWAITPDENANNIETPDPYFDHYGTYFKL